MKPLYKERALVTGITGFLGSHLGKLLLERGYIVRGTVRNKMNKMKLQPLTVLPHQDRLEIVEADLLDPDSWSEAVKGCDYVMHVASPFPTTTPKSEDAVIRPAVQGTLAVLNACKQHSVKHVVLTSSIAAVQSLGPYSKSEYTEEDWTNLSNATPYYKSKTLAEKAAWEMYNKLDKTARFKLTTILPGLIFGPSLVATDFTSGEIIRQLLTGELFALPKINYGVVDVRDVALAHVKALESPFSDGQRYLCCSESHFWFEEIAGILRSEFGKYGYKVTKRKLSYLACRFLSFFHSKSHSVLPFWGKQQHFNNDKIKKHFDMKFISGQEAIIQMGYSLIENNIIPNLLIKTKL